MPRPKTNNTCKTCEKPIRSKRVYCPDCFINFRTNRYKDNILKDCICGHCKKTYAYNQERGDTLEYCGNCKNNRMKKIGYKQKCLDYKGGNCEICGYNKSSRSLSFHHKDPSLKDFTISGSYRLSWERIKKELDKCVLVCANCHAEIHDGITQLPN